MIIENVFIFDQGYGGSGDYPGSTRSEMGMNEQTNKKFSYELARMRSRAYRLPTQ